MAGSSVVVQSVIYNNDVKELKAALRAAVQACHFASIKGIVSKWTIYYGDASPQTVLDEHLIDEFHEYAVKKGGAFKYTFFNKNTGHGGGHNRLSQLADSDFIIVLNPDGILAPSAIVEAINQIEPDVGLCDGRQIPLEHLKEYDPFTRDTDWCSGAFMTIRREVFSELQGFDHETFFMYCDDVDISWRARLLGWRTVHAPQARIFHDKRIDLDSHIEASESEHFYSREAAYLLAYKYSRDILAKNILENLVASDEPVSNQVAQSLNARISAGKLPIQLDHKHLVGIFIDGGYSRMRSNGKGKK